MSVSIIATAAPQAAISTQGLVTYLQSLFGPLFRGIVGIVALFFLFTRDITRFVQAIWLPVRSTWSSTRLASSSQRQLAPKFALCLDYSSTSNKMVNHIRARNVAVREELVDQPTGPRQRRVYKETNVSIGSGHQG